MIKPAKKSHKVENTFWLLLIAFVMMTVLYGLDKAMTTMGILLVVLFVVGCVLNTIWKGLRALFGLNKNELERAQLEQFQTGIRRNAHVRRSNHPR